MTSRCILYLMLNAPRPKMRCPGHARLGRCHNENTCACPRYPRATIRLHSIRLHSTRYPTGTLACDLRHVETLKSLSQLQRSGALRDQNKSSELALLILLYIVC